MIFKNPLRTGVLIKNILITICVKRVWIAIRYFLFEKNAFNGLLKVIGIQIILFQGKAISTGGELFSFHDNNLVIRNISSSSAGNSF